MAALAIRPSAALTPLRVRAIRDGLSLVGLGLVAVLVIRGSGDDAHAYWSLNATDPYRALVGGDDAFLYSPVAALVASPFHLLPFQAFRLLLTTAEIGALIYLVGPWALAAVAFLPVAQELSVANINLLLAAAVVIGFRRPGVWSFVLLTKITPGIGLLWFAVRREWRSLGIALGATLALALASATIEPAWWPAWIGILLRSASVPLGAATLPMPLLLRLPLATLVVAWGARTDRRWTVLVAATLAMPVAWDTSLVMLLGVPALARCPAAGVGQAHGKRGGALVAGQGPPQAGDAAAHP